MKNWTRPLGLRVLLLLFAVFLLVAIAISTQQDTFSPALRMLVGTPPNLAFARIYALSLPLASQVGFGDWMLFGLPTSLVMLCFAWFSIWSLNLRGKEVVALESSFIGEERKKLGPSSFEEKVVGAVFIAMAVLWTLRKDLHLGFFQLTGWSSLVAYPSFFDDATVSILMAMILFAIPVKNPNPHHWRRILDQSAIRDILWQIILLLGGGFALAKGMMVSGLSASMGGKFASLWLVGECCNKKRAGNLLRIYHHYGHSAERTGLRGKEYWKKSWVQVR